MYSIKKRCNYQNASMENALADVKNGTRTVSDAARHHQVPRSTLDHKVNNRHAGAFGGQTKLSGEEETALVKYIDYMDKIGHPLGVAEVKMFAWSIAKRSTNPDCFGENGPSHKWWRGFRRRHKNLTMRKPDKLDRRRKNTAKRSVVRKHFELLKEALKEADLLDKPEHIFNVDETGVEMNKGTRKVVVSRNRRKHYQDSVGDREHITANVCCSASGQALPPMLIFQKCFPSSDYSSTGPDDCLYAKSDNGWMDGELFLAWFKKIFLPKTAHLRPAMLIMDGHISHLTIDLIDLARENGVILYCLPPHLTHLLQPLDVAVFKSLKDYFTKYANQVKLVSLASDRILIVNRNNFTAIFREAFERCMIMATIKNGFRKCGIYPLEPTAVDWSKLTDDETIASASIDSASVPSVDPASVPSSSNASSTSNSTSTSASITAVLSHPIVESQLFPERLRDVLLVPHFEGQKKQSARVTTSARVLTTDEHRKLVQDKLVEKEQKEAEKAKRKAAREAKKQAKEQEKEERKTAGSKHLKAAQNRPRSSTVAPTRTSRRLAQLPTPDYAKIVSNNVVSESDSESEDLCNRCGNYDPPNDGAAKVQWLQCEACDKWYHTACEFQQYRHGPVICGRC